MTDGRVEFAVADLLAQEVDAIVNPANEALAHGGGVAGLIARAAGPELEEDSRRIGHCPTGDAVVTRAGRLPQRAVIHAVGPVWRGGRRRRAWRRSPCPPSPPASSATRLSSRRPWRWRRSGRPRRPRPW